MPMLVDRATRSRRTVRTFESIELRSRLTVLPNASTVQSTQHDLGTAPETTCSKLIRIKDSLGSLGRGVLDAWISGRPPQ